MGLDTSHDCWHGAYSAFHRWRNEMAKLAGYWFLHDSSGRDVAAIDWGHIPNRCLEGDWSGVEMPADPLIFLIAHSDCDGVIQPAQAIPLATRLEDLLPLLPKEPEAGHIGDWRIKTQRFIDGLRRAAAAGEPVEFH